MTIVFGSDEAARQIELDRVVFSVRAELLEEYGSRDEFLRAVEFAEAAVESEADFLSHLKDGPSSPEEIALHEAEVDQVKAHLATLLYKKAQAQWDGR